MQEMGLAYAWQTADMVSRTIAFVLLVMSILSWGVMIIKAGQLIKLRSMTRCAVTSFWRAESFEEGVKQLNTGPGNPFVHLAQAGVAANAHQQQQSSQLHSRFDLSDWLARCLKDVVEEHLSRLQMGLAVLASIGSTAPFVGLFGTVWGIYHALKVIGTSGDASLAQVAGPVGESLIMTAFGLFVAIPAVLGYNAISRRNKSVSHALRRFAHDLHAYFLTGARVSIAGNAAQPAAAASDTIVERAQA